MLQQIFDIRPVFSSLFVCLFGNGSSSALRQCASQCACDPSNITENEIINYFFISSYDSSVNIVLWNCNGHAHLILFSLSFVFHKRNTKYVFVNQYLIFSYETTAKKTIIFFRIQHSNQLIIKCHMKHMNVL